MHLRRPFIATVLVALFGIVPGGHSCENKLPTKQIVLELPPSPDNPRNSEGDFIQLRDGRILFVYSHFTSGGGDNDRAYLASRVSSDGGLTWSQQDRVVVPNEAGMNVMSVSLLRLPDGRIALFYLRKNSLEDCRPVVRFSSDEARTWGPPRLLTDSLGYYVVNNDRAVLLSSGRLVLPASLHKTPDSPWSNRGRIFCFLSDDLGRTWRRSAEAPNPDSVVTQEPGVVELKDRKLLLFCRTNAGVQYTATSEDGGEHWSPLRASSIASPLSPASIERIPATGDLLLVWNNTPGPLRTPFNLAISRDEGKTWEKVKTIESDPYGWYCYTAIEFVGRYVLLGHCAGDRRREGGLSRTHVTRLSLDWVYADATPEPHVLRDENGVVELGCDLRGAAIRYTLDGSLPNAGSAVYTEPFRVGHPVTLRMQAFHQGCVPSAVVTARVGESVLQPPVSVDCELKRGLRYLWVRGVFPSVDSLSRAEPAGSGTADSIHVGLSPEEVNFGLVFDGYLEVPRDGVYAFALTSNDGSALWVDGWSVVDNDGGHGARRVTGRIGLKRGLHRWRLLYFQLEGSRLLKVEWKPPGGAWNDIPPGHLYHCLGTR